MASILGYNPKGRFSKHDKPGNCCYRCGVPVSLGVRLTMQDGHSVCDRHLYNHSKAQLRRLTMRIEPDIGRFAMFGGRTGNGE
jgi:hypothetical protein